MAYFAVNNMGILLCMLLLIVRAAHGQQGAYWRKMANEDLQKMLDRQNNQNVAKNVILFVGDGMGVTTVTAARIFKGQKQNRSGEEDFLSFEDFPHVGLTKTYSVDFQTPDSASTATAFLSGAKTKSGVMGYDSRVRYGRCNTTSTEAELDTILHWSIAEGKSTGLVTTTRVTHATPAAAFAHCPDRTWEGDINLLFNFPRSTGCRDIAYQLVMNNSDIRVILGGGRRFFMPANSLDPQTGWPNIRHGRRDRLNLIREWEKDKIQKGANHSYVWNKEQFDQVNSADVDYLLGLFSSSHMSYEFRRPKSEPSIAEMTRKSIEILQKNQKGYFLMVEGGRIDHGHHNNQAYRALTDTLAFDDAIEVAKAMTNQSDTLIVVTADHSHVMVISGYSSRGNPILGLSDKFSVAPSKDGLPYTTLMYGNGPGHIYKNSSRRNLSDVDTMHASFKQDAAVPLSVETHSAEDVAVYARGPMSHLFTGVMEQNFIATAMAFASCVGEDKRHCLKPRMPLDPFETPTKSDADPDDKSTTTDKASTGSDPQNTVFQIIDEMPESSAISTHATTILTVFALIVQRFAT